MTDACQYIHDEVSRLSRLQRDDLAKVPANGVYVLFQKGEGGHGVDRVVRVGTHRGQNNLTARIREHLYTQNKDRRIFRKHVGRCLLAKAEDPFLAQWEIDLTTKASRERSAHKVDKVRLQEVEDQVTQYMVQNFSFAVLHVQGRAERLHFEECLLSTIFDCRDCGPSAAWLGKFHLEVIRGSGLWNVQSLRGHVLPLRGAQRLISQCIMPAAG